MSIPRGYIHIIGDPGSVHTCSDLLLTCLRDFLVLSVLISVLNFTLSNVLERYVFDFVPVLHLSIFVSKRMPIV